MVVVARACLPDVEVRKKLTPDGVYQMLEDGRLSWDDFFELDEGELVELTPVIGDHARKALRIAAKLDAFSQRAGGAAFDSSGGFMVGRNLQQLRAPDAAYIGPARAEESYPAFIRGAPDLAVEVLSKGQYTDASAKPKVREYLEAGAQLVWLVDLRRKEVRVYRRGSDDITVMRGKAVLTLEPIIAGFKLKVADIFR